MARADNDSAVAWVTKCRGWDKYRRKQESGSVGKNIEGSVFYHRGQGGVVLPSEAHSRS